MYMYNLELKENSFGYLCISVKGFRPLWMDYLYRLGLSYEEHFFPLEAILRDRMGLDNDEANRRSEEIRKRVKSLLPCKMSAKELQSIINECIEEI